jgi:hypothetical protein
MEVSRKSGVCATMEAICRYVLHRLGLGGEGEKGRELRRQLRTALRENVDFTAPKFEQAIRGAYPEFCAARTALLSAVQGAVAGVTVDHPEFWAIHGETEKMVCEKFPAATPYPTGCPPAPVMLGLLDVINAYQVPVDMHLLGRTIAVYCPPRFWRVTGHPDQRYRWITDGLRAHSIQYPSPAEAQAPRGPPPRGGIPEWND